MLKKHDLVSLFVLPVAQALKRYGGESSFNGYPALACFASLVGPKNKVLWKKTSGYSSIDGYDLLGSEIDLSKPSVTAVSAAYEEIIPQMIEDLAKSYAKTIKKK